jgi:hypothetical protein
MKVKKWMKGLDERCIMFKCLDEMNSKIVMLDENHVYMGDNYKKHEIFR